MKVFLHSSAACGASGKAYVHSRIYYAAKMSQSVEVLCEKNLETNTHNLSFLDKGSNDYSYR